MNHAIDAHKHQRGYRYVIEILHQTAVTNMTAPQMTQESQNGNATFQYCISVTKAVAQVAVWMPNQPICPMKMDRLISQEDPRSPKALVPHILAGRPKSVP